MNRVTAIALIGAAGIAAAAGFLFLAREFRARDERLAALERREEDRRLREIQRAASESDQHFVDEEVRRQMKRLQITGDDGMPVRLYDPPEVFGRHDPKALAAWNEMQAKIRAEVAAEHMEREIAVVTDALALNEERKAELFRLLRKACGELQDLAANRKPGDDTVQKKQAIRDQADGSVRLLLTEEQKKKYDELAPNFWASGVGDCPLR